MASHTWRLALVGIVVLALGAEIVVGSSEPGDQTCHYSSGQDDGFLCKNGNCISNASRCGVYVETLTPFFDFPSLSSLFIFLWAIYSDSKTQKLTLLFIDAMATIIVVITPTRRAALVLHLGLVMQAQPLRRSSSVTATPNPISSFKNSHLRRKQLCSSEEV